jgi:hypothetical protein
MKNNLKISSLLSKNYNLVLLGWLLLGACQPKGEQKAVVTNASTPDSLNYSLRITPDRLCGIEVMTQMQGTQQLNGGACMQFQDENHDIYLIVISDYKANLQKQHSLVDHQDFAHKQLKAKLKRFRAAQQISTTLGSFPALLSEVYGRVDDMSIFYYLAVVESPTHFYQVLAWTYRHQREQYLPAIDRMVRSFVEVDPDLAIQAAINSQGQKP